jgi:hypothetical protein
MASDWHRAEDGNFGLDVERWWKIQAPENRRARKYTRCFTEAEEAADPYGCFRWA